MTRRKTRGALCLLLLACALLLRPLPGARAQPFNLVPIESGVPVEITAQVPAGHGFRAETVTAVLFDPAPATRKAAAVIINSSGGVQPHTELFWGRLLAANGLASLVVDSFTARGVARTTDDQTRESQPQSDADAVGGFRFLAARTWVDASRIIVLGMSKGGHTALDVAQPDHMGWLGARDVMFAGHVALTPGGCTTPLRRAAVTTNRPILFMLADLDDQTPATHCLELADRMRQAGNTRVERALYPSVFHAMEWTGGTDYDRNDQNFAACRGVWEPDGSVTLGDPPQNMPGRDFFAWTAAHCVTRGSFVGGDDTTKHHLVDDLLGFLRRHGFIRDAALDALLGDCARFAAVYPRLVCERGHGGRIGDVVALGRILAYGTDAPHDDTLAARLFRWAAERGSPHGQLQYALFLQAGRGGLPRDPAAAAGWLQRAAAQDYAAAINALGAAYRDGNGVAKDDTEAGRLFRRAMLNHNPWAYGDVGQFYLTGRGGFEKNPAEALRLFRTGALLGNPWGQFNLAGMLERGEATPADRSAALALYRQAAAQEWAGKPSADAAVRRLESAAH